MLQEGTGGDTGRASKPEKVDIYTASREDLGVPAIDRKELEGFIDSIPEIPVAVRDNLKEDARIRKFDLKNV